jgi:N6-adenosine-specific RNA methylase IME4
MSHLRLPSSIIYQNGDQTITVLDIPRTLEEAQSFPPNWKKRLLSSKTLETPYPSVEPKSKKARAKLPQPSVDELLLVRYLELASAEVEQSWKGPWSLPRATEEDQGRKRKGSALEREDEALQKSLNSVQLEDHLSPQVHTYYHHNASLTTVTRTSTPDNASIILPPMSNVLHATISQAYEYFNTHAPLFSLILLDPPWPNHSARRKGSYAISWDIHEIQDLLASIPVPTHLSDDGLVGIWITNRQAFGSLVLDPCGLFDSWGLTLFEKWVWVKTTTSGKPVCPLDSSWRKPYEILLVGRKGRQRQESGNVGLGVKKRVIFGAPDLHSRKPNLKALFEQQGVRGECLEIFARNCTAGWWSWGDEVTKFQGEEHWVEVVPR